jgi:branched-chain amino acid transport system substrate-binding protein
MFFPGGAGSDPLGPFGKILSEVTTGRRLAFFTCSESAVCANAKASATAGAPKSGFTIVYSGTGSLAQPDFTSECIAMRDAKADVVVAVFDSASVQRVARSCSRQGYNPKYYLAGGVADASFAANPAFDGSAGGTHAFPFSVAKGTNAEADKFFAAMARFAPNTTVQPITTEGWVAGKMFERAAARVGTNPTSQEVLAGLWAFKGETLGGLATPRTFAKGAPATSSNCAFLVAIKDGKWLAPRGMDPVCG